jgi:hypothetical protein
MLFVAGTGTEAARADGPAFGWWPFGETKTDEAAASSAATTEVPTSGTAAAPPKTTRTAAAPLTTKSPATGGTTTARSAAVGSSAPGSQSTIPPSTLQSLPKSAVDKPWYSRSPFANVVAPKSPFASGKSKAEERRNAWVERRAEPEQASPWQTVTNGAHRVGASTKAAWQKTVDVLTPGDETKKPPTRVAKRGTEPSFWSRMTGQESKQPEGPRTVTEWMGQERLKP